MLCPIHMKYYVCAGAVETTSLFEYVFVLVTNRFRVSTLLKVLTLALWFILGKQHVCRGGSCLAAWSIGAVPPPCQIQSRALLFLDFRAQR